MVSIIKRKAVKNLEVYRKLETVSNRCLLLPKLDANLTIRKDVFLETILFFAKGGRKEIAGYGLAVEREIVWIKHCVTGHPGSVKGDIEYAQAIGECHKKTGKIPNCQWHTHPNFGVSFSNVDETDQLRVMEDLAEKNPGKQSEVYFLLMSSGTQWKTRRMISFGKDIFYADGRVILLIDEEEIPLEWEEVDYKSYFLDKKKVIYKDDSYPYYQEDSAWAYKKRELVGFTSPTGRQVVGRITAFEQTNQYYTIIGISESGIFYVPESDVYQILEIEGE